MPYTVPFHIRNSFYRHIPTSGRIYQTRAVLSRVCSILDLPDLVEFHALEFSKGIVETDNRFLDTQFLGDFTRVDEDVRERSGALSYHIQELSEGANSSAVDAANDRNMEANFRGD